MISWRRPSGGNVIYLTTAWIHMESSRGARQRRWWADCGKCWTILTSILKRCWTLVGKGPYCMGHTNIYSLLCLNTHLAKFLNRFLSGTRWALFQILWKRCTLMSKLSHTRQVAYHHGSLCHHSGWLTHTIKLWLAQLAVSVFTNTRHNNTADIRWGDIILSIVFSMVQQLRKISI